MNVCSYSCCVPAKKEAQRVASLASLLKLVAEESRLRILCILRGGKHCVCELLEHISLSQSLVSHHLKTLKDAGIVMDERRGLRVYYSLTKRGKDVTDLLFSLSNKEAKL